MPSRDEWKRRSQQGASEPELSAGPEPLADDQVIADLEMAFTERDLTPPVDLAVAAPADRLSLSVLPTPLGTWRLGASLRGISLFSGVLTCTVFSMAFCLGALAFAGNLAGAFLILAVLSLGFAYRLRYRSMQA